MSCCPQMLCQLVRALEVAPLTRLDVVQVDLAALAGRLQDAAQAQQIGLVADWGPPSACNIMKSSGKTSAMICLSLWVRSVRLPSDHQCTHQA